MRGSPLLRSLFIVLLLIASAAVLSRLTAARTPVAEIQAAPAVPEARLADLPYHLLLSAEAAEVRISVDDHAPSAALSGVLEVPSTHPVIFLTVRWKHPAGPNERRFAKLTLEPTGKSTLTHVFDASGDIDDVFELP